MSDQKLNHEARRERKENVLNLAPVAFSPALAPGAHLPRALVPWSVAVRLLSISINCSTLRKPWSGERSRGEETLNLDKRLIWGDSGTSVVFGEYLPRRQQAAA
jgi:hypothetical protein